MRKTIFTVKWAAVEGGRKNSRERDGLIEIEVCEREREIKKDQADDNSKQQQKKSLTIVEMNERRTLIKRKLAEDQKYIY